jgi:hypothetical protein
VQELFSTISFVIRNTPTHERTPSPVRVMRACAPVRVSLQHDVAGKQGLLWKQGESFV